MLWFDENKRKNILKTLITKIDFNQAKNRAA